MNNYREKFQALLRQLFQFESADLDFGIYRIMNFKRDVIERFIEKDLLDAVSKELGSGALAEQAAAARDIEDVKAQVIENLGEDALDPEGNLDPQYRNSKLGKRYQQLQKTASGAKPRPALEAVIFNHLYTFFSRYYDAGDFMSKRRYSKKEKYAIPYNGEEVYLHWANKDQYYIKTGEYFTDYRFKSGDITVHFKLQAADVEKDNVKGDKRFFIPLYKEAAYDADKREVIIPFHYRPLTEKEDITYGKKNQQDAIISETLEKIPKSFEKEPEALAAITAEKRKASDGKKVSFLEHHLRQYTQRNSSDFFIHKDIEGFLKKELDFYLKNEVLNLDELEAGGEARSEGWFQIMRVIKSIGHKIIAFLAQIENFQKMLFEKKKFVLETNYCITLGIIPEKLYDQIAEIETQWQEWKELFHIDEEEKNLFTPKKKKPRRVEFLKDHPTLVLDTKHLDQDLKDGLLATFESLDEFSDGLLVHSENLQALNLLQEKYRQKIQCIHIDPPYNTQTSGFLYKNDYQHSSWLAMMENRIRAGLFLMSPDGSYLCHIDENEYEHLQLLFESFSVPNAGTIAWDKRNPMNSGRGIATQHEYIIWRSHQETPIQLRNNNIILMLEKASEIINKYGKVTVEAQKEYAAWVNNNSELSGGEKAYRYLDEQGGIYQSVSLRAPEPRTNPKFFKPLIHPVTRKPCAIPPNGFSRTPETLQKMVENGEIIFGQDETTQPRQKVLLTEDSKRQISSLIQDGRKGKSDLSPLELDFPYCHPLSLYEELLGAAVNSPGDTVLDYFAGSGTTGHAVMNLNREDGGQRKFILVEMEEYINTIVLPRFKKVTFTPDWKDGKPLRKAIADEARRSPRIIKYIKLESYEDATNNIFFTQSKGQKVLEFDDYLLSYMLEWETRDSETMLNVAKLESPFKYKVTITEGQESREQVADLPETFTYLLGLNVKTRRVHFDGDRRYLVYRGAVDHKEVVVIWRETEGWNKDDFERDKKFVFERKLIEGADEVFVNSDSVIPGARSLDPIFKRRMFGEA